MRARAGPTTPALDREALLDEQWRSRGGTGTRRTSPGRAHAAPGSLSSGSSFFQIRAARESSAMAPRPGASIHSPHVRRRSTAPGSDHRSDASRRIDGLLTFWSSVTVQRTLSPGTPESRARAGPGLAQTQHEAHARARTAVVEQADPLTRALISPVRVCRGTSIDAGGASRPRATRRCASTARNRLPRSPPPCSRVKTAGEGVGECVQARLEHRPAVVPEGVDARAGQRRHRGTAGQAAGRRLVGEPLVATARIDPPRLLHDSSEQTAAGPAVVADEPRCVAKQ